jgi:metal-dependent HD superfamily phosphatase/phosphodiesterase
MAMDPETEGRIEQPVSAEAKRETRLTPAEAVAEMRIRVPERGNRKLRTLVERVNADTQLKAWWHVANVNAVARMEINDHSWVHIQIVTNIALKLLRTLEKHDIEASVVRDYGMTSDDAEIVVTLGALLHCTGMAVHRDGHEDWSLFLAHPKLGELLDGIYGEPEKTVIGAEVLQTITSHRNDGKPLTLEAGIVRVADALDMARGRSRVPFEAGHQNIHSLSAYAIEEVKLAPGTERAVGVEISMSNSAGIFQVDELLATKLRGSGLEEYIEVTARIDAEHEQRLITVFRI